MEKKGGVWVPTLLYYTLNGVCAFLFGAGVLTLLHRNIATALLGYGYGYGYCEL